MEKSYVLIDTAERVYVESQTISGVADTEFGKYPYKFVKSRLQGGVQDGLDVLEIDAGRFEFTILLSRGMNLLKARCEDVDLKWDSPVNGPVHPKFVPLFAPSGCGWLEGFSEWIARCGLESNGAPEFDANGVLKYPLHGRIANLPARRVVLTFDDEKQVATVVGEVLEASVFGSRLLLRTTYSIKLGDTKVSVQDEIVNLASVQDEFELLYHINTGYPLVSPGSKFLAAYKTMCPRDGNAVKELPEWNRFVTPVSGRPETCYFFDLANDASGDTTVAITTFDESRGLALTFNKSDFPYFILWKTQRPNSDIYVSGMEPAINFPNTRSFEKSHGRVMPIASGETKRFCFTLDALIGYEAVEEVVDRINELQESATPNTLIQPIPEWCE